MSFIEMGKLKDNRICVLDTEDLVTDLFTDKELNKVRDMGIEILKASKKTLNIGVKSNNNKYQIYINGSETPVYYGDFPESCKRNDLFAFEIKLADSGIVGDKLLIAIVANCWCKYDIEVPMVMCQVLYASIENIRDMRYACKTDEPVYFCTKDILRKQYNQCQGDFPDKSLNPRNTSISITENGLRVFGVEYRGYVPFYDILNDKFHYNIVKDV